MNASNLKLFLQEIEEIPAKDGWHEASIHFNYSETRDRIIKFSAEISRIMNKILKIDDGYEDAFFSFDVSEIFPEIIEKKLDHPKNKPFFAIRFSNWGNLAATWHIEPYPPLSKEDISIIKKTLENYGFIWMNGDLLKNIPYDRPTESTIIETWWDRFFSYS